MQNFRAKPDTKLANADEPDLQDLLWTIAAARLILPPDVHVQAPPNLSPGVYQKLIGAGIDDWGGVSPVTPDHVNPEAPWPELEALGLRTAEMDKILVPRLPVYPAWAAEPDALVASQGRDPRDAVGRCGGLGARRRLGPRPDLLPQTAPDAARQGRSRHWTGLSIAQPPARGWT